MFVLQKRYRVCEEDIYVFALILFILGIASASAEEPIIGLLTLPEVLGEGPCDHFSPEDITLYSGMEKN